MWTAEVSEVEGGRRYRVRLGEVYLSWRAAIEQLQAEPEFADFLSATLAADPAPGYFMECPPVSAVTVDDAFEFLLLDADNLATREAEWTAFAARFEEQDGGVIAFPNIDGDADLIVPRPPDASVNWSHLAAFVRTASPETRLQFWQLVAQRLTLRLGSRPVWLNTEGTGVPWLHMRIDSRPKYYHHRPYAQVTSP